jgi:hypothetical protein
MWHLIPWGKQVLIVTAVAMMLAWAADGVAEWLQDGRAPLLKFISVFATIIAVGVAGIASRTWRYLWRRFPLMARKTFPDLNGTWVASGGQERGMTM